MNITRIDMRPRDKELGMHRLPIGLPRLKRASGYPPIQINRRKQLMLEAIKTYHYLTALQCGRACRYRDGSISTTQTNLQQLYHAGYVDRMPAPGLPFHGWPPFVYSLTSKGQAYLRKQGKASEGRFKGSEQAQREGMFLAHTLACNDFLILSSKVDLADERVTLSQMLTERELKRHYAVYVADGKEKVFQVPDGWIELSFGESFLCVGLELDQGTARRGAICQKIRSYTRYDRGMYQEKFGTDVLTVVFLTTAGEKRRRELLSWTEDELERIKSTSSADLFRFASFDPAREDPTVFFEPFWYRPYDKAAHPLIDRREL